MSLKLPSRREQARLLSSHLILDLIPRSLLVTGTLVLYLTRPSSEFGGRPKRRAETCCMLRVSVLGSHAFHSKAIQSSPNSSPVAGAISTPTTCPCGSDSRIVSRRLSPESLRWRRSGVQEVFHQHTTHYLDIWVHDRSGLDIGFWSVCICSADADADIAKTRRDETRQDRPP
jgi:hypothetical protein